MAGRLVALLIAVLTSTAAVPAGAQSGPDGHEPVTPAAIEKRLEGLAAEVQQYATRAPRVALVDFAWPASDTEYRALGKLVVVLVVAVSQEFRELPVKRVYAYARGHETVFQKISSERREVAAGSPIRALIGSYREDSFYLAPTGPMTREGELLIDFAANRDAFRLRELPDLPPDFIQKDRSVAPVRGANPEPLALRAFIQRRYPGFPLPPDLR